MKPKSIILIALSALLLAGCEKEDRKDTPVLQTMHVQLYENGSFSVRMQVTHDGSNRDLYAGFVVQGRDVDVRARVDSFIQAHTSAELLALATNEKKQILKVSNLRPERDYTYIAFGLTADGSLQGTPASCRFTTEKSDIQFHLYDQWTVRYAGEKDYANWTRTAVSVQVGSLASERFIITLFLASELLQSDTLDVLLDELDYFNNLHSTSTNQDYYYDGASLVGTGSVLYYDYLEPGQYQAMTIGVNTDGTPTGHYALSAPFQVEPYTQHAAYKSLVENRWKVVDATGNSFYVRFEADTVNRSLQMTGWGNWSEVSVHVRFDMGMDDASYTDRLTITQQKIPDFTGYTTSDGETYVGFMYMNGYYLNASGKTKLLSVGNSSSKLAWGVYQTDGSYQLSRAFYVTLDNAGTKADTYGMTLEFMQSSTDYWRFTKSTMQFPIQMTISN